MVTQVGVKHFFLAGQPRSRGSPRLPVAHGGPSIHKIFGTPTYAHTENDEIWYERTCRGGTCSYGVSRAPSQGGGAPRTQNFWDFLLHARTQYKKKQPNFA